MWTGNDCSLRKCPYGDDPLTVVSYDPESEGTGGTAATSGDASNVLYTGYSPYRQAPERQTLEIDSDHHMNTGTFTLTFTDEYGDKWTTRPIPTVVRCHKQLQTQLLVLLNLETRQEFINLKLALVTWFELGVSIEL